MNEKNMLQVTYNQLPNGISEQLLNGVTANGFGKNTDSAWIINAQAEVQGWQNPMELQLFNKFMNLCLVNGFGNVMIIKNPSN